MTFKVQHRILTVHDKQYHAVEWSKNSFASIKIRELIIKVLQENEVLFYEVDGNKVFTNDAGLFHIQMELVNEIELV